MVHILVVEDDARLNQAVCTYLNDSGFAATGCLTAAAAYEAMYNTLYDLIVSDIMMPGEETSIIRQSQPASTIFAKAW